MANIDPKEVKKLRDKTKMGIMACKKALKEAKGDFDRAKSNLMEKAKEKSAKKKDREINSGLIKSYVHNGRVGVLLKLGSETDFVAKNDDFKELAHELCLQIASMDPEDRDELLEQPYIKDQGKTVKEVIDKAVGKIGENIQVAEFTRYEI